MKRTFRLVAFAIPSAALLIASSVAWYALAPPPVENLPLPADLIAISSTEGRQLLLSSPDRTDYAQLEPVLVPQSRRAFCGPATSAAVINAALKGQTTVTQSSLFNDTAVSAIKSELAVTLSGLTLEELAQLLRARNVYHELIVFPDDIHETLLHSRWIYTFDRMEAFLTKFLGEPAAGK